MSPSSYFPVLFSNVEHYILSKRIFLFHAQKLWAFVGSRTRVLSYCSPIFFHCASQPRQNVVCFDQYLCAGQSIHRSKYTFSFFEKSFKKFQKRWKIGRKQVFVKLIPKHWSTQKRESSTFKNCYCLHKVFLYRSTRRINILSQDGLSWPSSPAVVERWIFLIRDPS